MDNGGQWGVFLFVLLFFYSVHNSRKDLERDLSYKIEGEKLLPN